MSLKYLQEKTNILQASNDALCFGLDPKEIDYLKTLKVEPHTIESLKTAGEISTKFNIIVFGSVLGLFSAFSIVEKYIGHLLPNAKILMKTRIDSTLDDTKNTISQLAKSLKFVPAEYIHEEKNENELWVILARTRK